MKELKEFTVEQLEEFIDDSENFGSLSIASRDLKALAKIALAAKQAKPSFDDWLSSLDATIEVDCGCVTNEAFYHWIRVAYDAAPPLNHTELVKSQSAPMQAIHVDQFGTIRFKANPIVQHLLDVAGNVGVNMNTIAMEGFEPEDLMQFAQLIGYSLSGYGELSYVTDEAYEIACDAAPKPEM